MSSRDRPSRPGRRRWLLGAAAALAGCAAPRASSPPWPQRLRGDTVALLGEVHDQPALHRLRLAVLEQAVATGWRPAIAMEQFDTDRQGDLDRAQQAPDATAQSLIDAAAPERSGWDWALYCPLLALALAHRLPLLAANLSRAEATRLVHADAQTALGPARSRALGLDVEPDPGWQQAQQQEIDTGHCHALPAGLLPGMARAQFGRDAVMAEMLVRHAERGVVLIAGNGHVRRDLGVPRRLLAAPWSLAPARVLAVGFIETGSDLPADAFDAVVTAAPSGPGGDPCAAFKAPSA